MLPCEPLRDIVLQIRCTRCNKILRKQEVGTAGRRSLSGISGLNGFTVQGAVLVCTGICATCQMNSAETARTRYKATHRATPKVHPAIDSLLN